MPVAGRGSGGCRRSFGAEPFGSVAWEPVGDSRARATPEAADADIALQGLSAKVPAILRCSFSFASNIDVFFELSENVEFIERLMKLGRVILFDKRGTGLSDRSA